MKKDNEEGKCMLIDVQYQEAEMRQRNKPRRF
jgi:hypothetical protein